MRDPNREMTMPNNVPGRPLILPVGLEAVTPAEVAADRIIARLHQAGFSAYRVGGSVRDRLLGREPAEVDVATSAPPAQVRQLFPDSYAIGEAFGVILVHGFGGTDVEVATFRLESGYADGRHPAHVAFSDAATDASRRDFTINALFYDPLRREILDYVGGLDDLRRGLIRAIGEPAARFSEDFLRMLRAVRFAAQLGFRMDVATRQAIPALAKEIGRLSAERVFAELGKMLRGGAPGLAFRELAELGLLKLWLPEVAAMSGVEQPEQFHPEGDVWQHTVLMLETMRAPSLSLAWAVLLHDVGKPPTQEFRDGIPRFPCHAEVGAKISQTVLRRLKAPRWLIDQVGVQVRNHMTFKDVPEMRGSTLRRLIARETFADELELHRLDCLASHGSIDHYCFLLDRLRQYANEPVIPPPLITGKDVLSLGLAPGPAVGKLLHAVQELQLNGELTSREQALEWVRGMIG